MGAMSWWHWVIIIAAFVLIFGAKKLPDAARGIGRSLRILKSEVNAMHEEGKGAPAAEAPVAQAPQIPATAVPPPAPAAAPLAEQLPVSPPPPQQ